MASRLAKLLAASGTDSGVEIMEAIGEAIGEAKEKYDELCEEAGLDPLEDTHDAMNEYLKVEKGDDDE